MANIDEATRTPWLALNIAGQWLLLLLLVTYAVARRLPQRNNPFLINFVVTSFLSTIPPSLLVYANKQHEKASANLCFMQVALMDGSTFMFSIAQFLLVFDTWSELRSACLHKSHFTRKTLTKYFLISLPYFALSIGSLASFVVAVRSPQLARYDGFAYCILNSSTSQQMRVEASGWFVSIATLVGLVFEVWVCWMIYAYPAKAQKDPLTWKTNIQFAIRVLAYNLLAHMMVVVTHVSAAHPNNLELKAAYRLMISMHALFVFVVFGTQKSVLRVWTSWIFWRRSGDKTEQDLQPQAYPVLDWGEIPTKRPKGSDFDFEEKGRV